MLLPSQKLMLTAGKLLGILHLYHPSQSPPKLPHPSQLRGAATSHKWVAKMFYLHYKF